jgi:hypothetical protein
MSVLWNNARHKVGEMQHHSAVSFILRAEHEVRGNWSQGFWHWLHLFCRPSLAVRSQLEAERHKAVPQPMSQAHHCLGKLFPFRMNPSLPSPIFQIPRMVLPGSSGFRHGILENGRHFRFINTSWLRRQACSDIRQQEPSLAVLCFSNSVTDDAARYQRGDKNDLVLHARLLGAYMAPKCRCTMIYDAMFPRHVGRMLRDSSWQHVEAERKNTEKINRKFK